MEVEGPIADRQFAQRSELLAGAARVAVGLSCVAIQVPRPGVELITADLHGAPYLTVDDDAVLNSPPGVTTIAFNDSDEGEDSGSLVVQHLDSLITNLLIPESWKSEGIEEPTEDCRIYARRVLRRLFEDYGIIPYKTSISKDGGLFVAYRSVCGRNILRVEIDNDLDAVAVVTDGAAILNSGLLEGDDVERAIINSFNPVVA
jgi:hypothetical protein